LHFVANNRLPNPYFFIKIAKNFIPGYVVYRFDDTNVVIAEKPCYGNATYIIKDDWEETVKILNMNRLSARRLRQTDFVIHHTSEQWITELKRKFNFHQFNNIK
jgi:hypothetical protein